MDNRKKITWLVKGLGVGGVEQLLAMSVPYLSRQDFSYEIVYMLPWKDKLVGHFTANGIPVSCLDTRSPADLRVISRLTSYLKERRPDLLEIHLPYPGIIGRFAGKLARIKPIVYVEHSLAVQKNLYRLHFLSYLGNILTYSLNDYIVAVSEDTHRDVRRHCPGGMPTSVVYNGINLAGLNEKRYDIAGTRKSLGIPADHKVVGHVANLLPKKRQEDLLRAAQRVLAASPGVTFVIVGRGPLEKKLKETARHLGIQDNVIFTGFVEDLYEVMQTFDVFVMSSSYEGFGISLAEAMAMGKPAIATRTGGMTEVIEDGVSGLLVEPRNPEGLAGSILTLLDDDNMRMTMGRAARERIIQRFDVRKRVAAMENLYRSLLNIPAPVPVVPRSLSGVSEGGQ
jgi:glycosyltransferase involved in cell wall biosynthesis